MRRLSSVDYLVNEQGCWLWQLSRNSAGYGMKWDQKDRRLMLAHRWYYERERGAIPAGLQLDHLCGVRVCVNPTHLEAVTPEENARRSIARRPRKPPRIREQPEIRAVDLGACVAWQGCRDRDGYGAKWVDGRRVFVHRWAYEQVHGPIPPGMTIDHLCRNPACYNASHLELVSRAENNRRAAWRYACKHGHLMTPDTTLWEANGKRRCRICKTETRERSKRRVQERRQRAEATV
jgi:HNH endonuclease